MVRVTYQCVPASQGTRFTGSALVRLLARLTDLDVPERGEVFADRLSHWLSWADAISLSSALSSVQSGDAGHPPAAASDAQERERHRVRSSLAKAIADDSLSAADFASHRRACFIRQQDMETSIGPLRAHLRAALTARSPTMARLAAVDAVMEQVLGARERSLLSAVPVLLERRFEQLRQAHQSDEAEPDRWLDIFRKDMRGVLLAELDLRLQPCEGLLDALRAS